jgi:hypothetical protein
LGGTASFLAASASFRSSSVRRWADDAFHARLIRRNSSAWSTARFPSFAACVFEADCFSDAADDFEDDAGSSGVSHNQEIAASS